MNRFKKKPILSDDAELVRGNYHLYKDWIKDKKGYFLIRINKRKKLIEAGHCKKGNIIDTLISGKTPQEIYLTAIKKKLISRLDHAAYLGKELEKAYLALENNIVYVQDEELRL